MLRTCKYCDEDFNPKFGHPGLITVCLDADCQDRMLADGVREPEPLTAEVSWSGKHTCEIRVVADPMQSARFNNAQRRFGAGVMASLSSGGPLPMGRKAVAGKDYGMPKDISEGTGKGYADPGAIYRSNLGTYNVRR